jgi:solute carrier family 25 (peroxisomal adenine nucleotide transporter), member 17
VSSSHAVVAGLYVGLVPGLVLCIYPAIQHTIFDRLKKWYFQGRDNHKELPAALAFVFGLVANVVTLLICYPLIYVKVRVQAQRHARLGSIAMIIKIVR